MNADLGRFLIIAGIILIILGLVFILSGKLPFPGKLPGDILIKRENFTFFFPVTTCILASIVLSLVLFLIFKRPK